MKKAFFKGLIIALYRKSAGYESGLHYVSVPTPYTMGWTPMDGEPKPIKLSSASFIHFPDTVQQVGKI